MIRTAALFKTKYKIKWIQHLKTFPIEKVTMLKIIRQHILQALTNLNVMNSEALKGTFLSIFINQLHLYITRVGFEKKNHE